MTDAIEAHAEELLVGDRRAHADAIAALAGTGDEPVLPYLFEVSVIDAIADDWASFGIPEELRERDPPRYFELPEVA